MKEVIITLSYDSETKNLKITADNLELGSQYDNNATKLVFQREDEMQDKNLLVVFASSFGKQKFVPIPVVGNDFVIPNLFTQGERLWLQVILDIDKQEVRSNKLEFTLRPSITSFKPPAIELPYPDLDDFLLGTITSTNGNTSKIRNEGDQLLFSVESKDEVEGKAELLLKPNGLTLNGDKILTEKEVKEEIADAPLSESHMQSLVDLIYPVGSILFTTSNINPSLLYKGTEWVSWGAGRFIMGADPEKEKAEATGGNSHITLKEENMPTHSHSYTPPESRVFGLVAGEDEATLSIVGASEKTQDSGLGEPVEAIPPYITAFVWKRVQPAKPVEPEE